MPRRAGGSMLHTALEPCVFVPALLKDRCSMCGRLRSSAGVLESIIWSYRARVTPFELDTSDPDSRRPEARLCDALVKWRRNVVSGGELQTSSIRKNYPHSVYRHGQFARGESKKLFAAADKAGAEEKEARRARLISRPKMFSATPFGAKALTSAWLNLVKSGFSISSCWEVSRWPLPLQDRRPRLQPMSAMAI